MSQSISSLLELSFLLLFDASPLSLRSEKVDLLRNRSSILERSVVVVLFVRPLLLRLETRKQFGNDDADGDDFDDDSVKRRS